MSKRKSERLMNLLIALLSARVPLTRQRIREFNEGYHGLSDVAFEQAFERDKKELRALGVVIHTGEVDSEWGNETGYRVDRVEFELPELDFTAQEKAVLGAAAHVWQESVAARDTGDALTALRAAGVETDATRLMTLRPQLRTDDGYATARKALEERRELRFDYRGELRRVHPWQLVQRRGQWYLLAHDVDKGEPRRFKLQRLTSPMVMRGRAEAYEIPDELPHSDFERDDATALVALEGDVVSDLLRTATPAHTDGAVPPGWTAWQVRAATPELLVAEICALGPAAVVLEPDEVRSAVIAHLRRVAGGAA